MNIGGHKDFIFGILKFAGKEQSKKFRRKIFFSGISEAAHPVKRGKV